MRRRYEAPKLTSNLSHQGSARDCICSIGILEIFLLLRKHSKHIAYANICRCLVQNFLCQWSMILHTFGSILPVVVNTNGVKVPCSICIARSLYIYSSCFLRIHGSSVCVSDSDIEEGLLLAAPKNMTPEVKTCWRVAEFKQLIKQSTFEKSIQFSKVTCLINSL